jgi:hypothetical protein
MRQHRSSDTLVTLTTKDFKTMMTKSTARRDKLERGKLFLKNNAQKQTRKYVFKAQRFEAYCLFRRCTILLPRNHLIHEAAEHNRFESSC